VTCKESINESRTWVPFWAVGKSLERAVEAYNSSRILESRVLLVRESSMT